MLEDDGGLRWSRLENLMEESSKSVGYDASQLWLLAGASLLLLLLPLLLLLRHIFLVWCA